MKKFINKHPVKSIGILFFIVGIGLMFFHLYPKEWKYYNFINEFYANASMELISIAITVLIIDVFYQKKADAGLKQSLIRELGSGEKGFASKALKELKVRNWLYDGSLKNADLENCNLEGLDLSNANLEGANISNANLNKTNFSGCNLKNSVIKESDLSEATFTATNLSNAELFKSNFLRCNMERVILVEAELVGTDFSESNMRQANLTKAKLYDTSLYMATLTNATLNEVEYRRPNFDNAKVGNAKFIKANLSGMKEFESLQDVDTCDFSGAFNEPVGFQDWLKEQ